MRLAVGAGLLSVTMAGCSAGTGNVVSAASSGSPPPPNSSVPSDKPAVKGIPASALLQPSDTRNAEAQPLEEGDFSHVRPLRPCGDAKYSSDGSRTDAVATRFTVPGAEQGSVPSVVVQFVGKHAAGGAADQFKEIDAALDKCPGGLGKDQHKWTIIDADANSILVRIEQRFSYADEEPATVSHFAALSKVNDAIVVVADLGWENMGGSEALVRDLIAKAEKRAATIG